MEFFTRHFFLKDFVSDFILCFTNFAYLSSKIENIASMIFNCYLRPFVADAVSLNFSCFEILLSAIKSRKRLITFAIDLFD